MSTTRKVTIDHEGKTYFGRIARIKSTALGYEDHGILTAMLHCEWDGGGIGVGGYCLDEPADREDYRNHDRRGTAYGLDHIIRFIDTVGVERWEDLKGADVVVLFEGESTWGAISVGIAGLHSDKVLILKAHAESWREAEAVIA